MCWGENDLGQLGNSSIDSNGTPIPGPTTSLTSGVVAISAGKKHTCALLGTGHVWCWGYNGWGQLGDGTIIGRAVPVSVSGLTRVKSISAGGDHTCAVTDAGGALCWGRNDRAQIGDRSTTANKLVPTQVHNLESGVRSISAGDSHTCAVTEAGGAWCWGDSTHGQLGNGSSALQASPFPVLGHSSGVLTISAGVQHTCALTALDTAKCWGINDNGQLGNGTNAETWGPTPVIGFP